MQWGDVANTIKIGGSARSNEVVLLRMPEMDEKMKMIYKNSAISANKSMWDSLRIMIEVKVVTSPLRV